MQLATLCFIKKHGKTLMLHRNKKVHRHQNTWNGLGGKFDPGESPEDCVIREVEEECGLQIIKPQLKGIMTFPKTNDDKGWMVFVFECDQYSGKLRDTDEGTLERVDDNQISKLKMLGADHHMMQWLRDGKFFSAKIVFEALEDGNVMHHEVNFY